MSGHSKWANIKNKKEKTDSQRGKIFTKIGREIAIAVREGGGDPANNSKLRDVIAKAKASNMPNENISRSIKKASGELGSVSYEEIVYEGYGPGGVAVMVEVVTDNRNRAAADVRHCFDKSGGSLGANGCVSYMFDRKGVIVIERTTEIDEDKLMEAALEAGAEDFITEDDAFEIRTEVADFSSVRESLESAGYSFITAELSRIPQTMVENLDEETAQKMMKLLERLEDNDDVQEVFHNAVLPEDDDE
ncbi:MAG: YebC/PmpR family DNA-binding transcriptional regulator [Eubacteriales bacterium]|nr:YebC/PmpR family DNA-binding transcriptional regulator [Eubacteriales bacterium]MDD7550936.1 YebC/PmpR family DNA-binding transcriptional regulator [Clostridia bacterium]MDY5754365.1 YebC/PmpR family DNA-binding transcriptional regulator [Eubacteriales bacterium]